MSFNSDLPSLENLLTPHSYKGKSLKKANCGYKYPTKASSSLLHVDNKLLHWEEWMAKRKAMHKKLCDLLQRQPGELLMNSTEECNVVRVNKIIMEYTRIPKPDRYRGNPNFWQIPSTLKDPTCFVTLTNAEKYQISSIQHIGVSKGILTEKDLLPRTRNAEILWEKLPYLKQQTQKQKKKIATINPHNPEFDELYIQGKPLTQALVLGSTEPSTTETDGESSSCCVETTSKQTLCLKINNFVFTPGELHLHGTRKAIIFFDHDVTSNSVTTEYLTFHNDGSVVIRYYWKPVEQLQMFDFIKGKTNNTFFYFNKNQGIIIPDQTINFPIWFKNNKPGTYTENWEIYTSPNVMPEGVRFIVQLHASASLCNMSEKIAAIEHNLNNKVRDRLIKEVLGSIFDNMNYTKCKPTVYCYNKKQVFEAINTDRFDAVNTKPRYKYNKVVVRELQSIYKNVKRPTDPKNWNYNIEELRLLTKLAMKSKHISKTTKLGTSRKKLDVEKINFPWSSSDVTPTSSNTNVQPQEDPSLPTNLSQQLEEVLAKLEQPVGDLNTRHNIIYTSAYAILCTCFNKVGEEFENIKKRFGIVKETRYPKSLQYQNFTLEAEKLPDVIQGPSLFPQVENKNDKPAAECLLNIPSSDCEKRYKIYYDTPGLPSLKDAKPAATKKDEKKPIASNNLNDSFNYKINEAFDPYLKVDLPKHEEENIDTSSDTQLYDNTDTMSSTIQQLFSHNLYVFMYDCLGNAIDTIVDMIELNKPEDLPHSVIKQITGPKYKKRLIDLKRLLHKNTAGIKTKRQVAERSCSTNTSSQCSLWTLLRTEKVPKITTDKVPISYPAEHGTNFKFGEAVSVNRLVTESTSTLDGRLDLTWLDFKEVGLQKELETGDSCVDLQERIETVQSETSVHSLITSCFDKSTQKNLDEYVSEEEYFYDNPDSLELNLSIDSECGECGIEDCMCN